MFVKTEMIKQRQEKAKEKKEMIKQGQEKAKEKKAEGARQIPTRGGNSRDSAAYPSCFIISVLTKLTS
jgi:hypothetical protein